MNVIIRLHFNNNYQYNNISELQVIKYRSLTLHYGYLYMLPLTVTLFEDRPHSSFRYQYIF